jgi:hypothetical protein
MKKVHILTIFCSFLFFKKILVTSKKQKTCNVNVIHFTLLLILYHNVVYIDNC